MKKTLLFPFAIFLLVLTSCGGGKQSAASIAKEWCDLNGKAHKAAEGTEKEAAETALKKFETDMEAKYKDDKTFMKEIEKEVEKCEDASEGK